MTLTTTVISYKGDYSESTSFPALYPLMELIMSSTDNMETMKQRSNYITVKGTTGSEANWWIKSDPQVQNNNNN